VTLTSASSGTSYQVSSSQPGGYSIEVPFGTYDVDGISLDDYSDGNSMHSPPSGWSASRSYRSTRP
jgi:hypothetical protein